MTGILTSMRKKGIVVLALALALGSAGCEDFIASQCAGKSKSSYQGERTEFSRCQDLYNDGGIMLALFIAAAVAATTISVANSNHHHNNSNFINSSGFGSGPMGGVAAN
jgi:hypothetical protein